MQGAIAEALKDPKARETYFNGGFIPVGNKPDAFAEQYRADYQRWAAVVKAANIQPD